MPGRGLVQMVLCPQKEVTVRDGDKFITLYPGDTVERITYGIDFSAKAEVIGKQWFTWAGREDDHYSVAIAPARTFVTKDEVYNLRRAGYIRVRPACSPLAPLTTLPCRCPAQQLSSTLAVAAWVAYLGCGGPLSPAACG